jgi:hypothetical protein
MYTGAILRPFGLLIMWPFGIFCGNLDYYFRVGILYKEKSGNPDFGKNIFTQHFEAHFEHGNFLTRKG